MRRIALALLILAACTNGSRTASSAPTPATELPATGLAANATVDYVVDGDTVDMTIDGVEERVRLIGIDTPETKKANTPVQCFGPEATAYTQSLLPEGTAVYLERDVEARDIYGRLLAYAYVVETGAFVNLAIVREGYAQTLTIPPNVAHSSEFVQAARDAERDNVGLWAACSG
ncbi:MAG: thermonuclease family protein [Actinomycetia bacterium]|nr:thermonuclease family protein [Actinomycetes bacterium]